METISFTRMEDGTAEEYQYLGEIFKAHILATHADHVLNLLKLMKGPKLGYKIDRYEHSLQSATRALRAGEEEEMVVAALLHDIGDPIAPDNHSAMAAAMLKPYVSDETHWVVQHHGLFQGYYYFHHVGLDRDARDEFRDHPHYQRTVQFCADYDQNCFDPDYENLPLETFEPMVRRLFAKDPKWTV